MTAVGSLVGVGWGGVLTHPSLLGHFDTCPLFILLVIQVTNRSPHVGQLVVL